MLEHQAASEFFVLLGLALLRKRASSVRRPNAMIGLWFLVSTNHTAPTTAPINTWLGARRPHP